MSMSSTFMMQHQLPDLGTYCLHPTRVHLSSELRQYHTCQRDSMRPSRGHDAFQGVPKVGLAVHVAQA